MGNIDDIIVHKTDGGHEYLRDLEEKYDIRQCRLCGRRTAFYRNDYSICRISLLNRLQPFSQGAFSGNVSDWPQLKPLLKDLFDYLSME